MTVRTGKTASADSPCSQSAHLGVSHIREQLLLSLVQLLCRVIAVHGQQVMAKSVHPGEHGRGLKPGGPLPSNI